MKIRPSSKAPPFGIFRLIGGGLLGICALAMGVGGAQAEPSGGTLVNNSALVRGATGADIASVANGPGFDVTVTQNAARVVIDWTDFNIDAADAVHFDQLASNWIAVNRVTGGLATPTAINGMLTGAGHIWVLDPSGVAFGAGAIVDVGGLLATTSALDAATFVATDPATGAFTFTEDGAGSVTNAAALNAQGLIALIAPVVENSGSLISDNGDVLLGGAKAFRLRFAEADRTPSGGGAVYQELLVTDFIIDTGVDNAGAPAETVPITQTAAGSSRASNIIISAASVGGGAFLNVDGLVEATNVGTGSGSVMLLGGASLVGGSVAATGTDIIRTADLGITATGTLTIQGSSVSIASSVQNISVGSAAVNAVTGDASLNDAIVTNVGAINVNAANGNVDAAALTAATSISLSGQDIDLTGKADATTTAMLTATAGNISAVGMLEVEGSAVTLTGAALGGTGVTLTSTAGAVSADAVTATTGDVAVSATGGNATLGDVVATTGAIGIGAATGDIDVGATTAGTSITISGQDIDLTGNVRAGTLATLTATSGDISSTGALEIEAGSISLFGRVSAATDILLTALTGGISSTGSLTATLGDIIGNAPSGPISVNDLVAGNDIRHIGASVDIAGTATAHGSAFVQALTGNVNVGGSVNAVGGALVLNAANGTALLNRIGALNDVTLTVADLDLSGSITAGDQFILETARTGQTIVLGGDGSTGGDTLRRTAGLIIDESELTKISAGRFDVDGGANDVLLLDARFDGATLDTLMIGTDQSSRIIAAGVVTGLSSLQLGYQTGGIDRRPGLILVSGQLGLDTAAGRLGTVRLESSDDIVIGTERFLEIFETGALSLLGLASLPTSVVGGITDHVFIATDQLQFVAPGSIVQLNTGRGVDGAGIVFGVPAAGDGVLFPSETGPAEVLLFGDVIRADGSRVSGFSASLEDSILFGGNTMTSTAGLAQNNQYYLNYCLIGDPVSCSADSLREVERNNRFINGDPSGLGGVIPVVFETGEDDERNEEEDLGGVAASGNEALWDAGSR